MSKMHDLRALYAAWKATREMCNTGLDMESPEYDEAFKGLLELERQILSEPARTVVDMALQIIVADDEGDMSTNTMQRQLVKLAYECAGIPIFASWSPEI